MDEEATLKIVTDGRLRESSQDLHKALDFFAATEMILVSSLTQDLMSHIARKELLRKFLSSLSPFLLLLSYCPALRSVAMNAVQLFIY